MHRHLNHQTRITEPLKETSNEALEELLTGAPSEPLDVRKPEDALRSLLLQRHQAGIGVGVG